MFRQLSLVLITALGFHITASEACTDFHDIFESLTSNTSQRILSDAPMIKSKASLVALKNSKAYQQCVKPGIAELWSADCSDLESAIGDITGSPLPWDSFEYDNYDYGNGEFDAIAESNYCRTDPEIAFAKDLVKKLGADYSRELYRIQVQINKYTTSDSESPAVKLDHQITLYEKLTSAVQSSRATFMLESEALLSQVPSGCNRCH